ncbi:helix-turn-helix domain-containing protein [Kaarinaea lacus]
MSDVAEVEESKTTESAEVSTKVAPWERLRKAREEQGMEQGDVAKELKLDLRFVKALEMGELDQLPQPVYTAGYIRAYAKLVGLPPDEIVGDYASQESTSMPEIVQVQEKVPARYSHVDSMLPKSFSVSHGTENKPMRMLVIVLAAAVVLAIAWQVYTNMQVSTSVQSLDTSIDTATPGELADENAESAQVAQVNSEKKIVKLALPGQSASESNTDGSAATGSKNAVTEKLQENAQKMVSISLQYSEDSWIDIRDATGAPLIRRLGKAGGSNTVTGVAPFEVLLGYSPGVSIQYNGEPYDISSLQSRPVARFLMDGGKQPSALKTPPRSLVTGNTATDKAENYGTVEEE